MKKLLSYPVLGKTALFLIIGLAFTATLFGTVTASAQGGGPVDWRGNLTCPSEHQVREGVLYCTGTDGTEHLVHVLVVDLAVSSLRFEYIIPKGASDGHDDTQECRDPNVPEWGGPAEGCFVPGNRGLYPRIKLPEAIERAKEVRSSPPVVAVVNADYGAPDGSHGPEGLLVIRGERLDGADRCDDDYNAALRPWLGLGETVDPATGHLPTTISRLERDSSPVPTWLYTGVGGGPWLVRDGELYAGAADCRGDGLLEQIDPVINCTGGQKDTPQPPKTEGYSSGSCRATQHTAAGISQDSRWLFLAVSTGADPPDILAEFMHDQLGAWNALKFDGGGSSQLWFNGSSPVRINPLEEERALSNYLALYGPSGNGIELPLEAMPVERVYYQVITSGERAEFTLAVENTGSYSWLPEDGVELRLQPFFALSPKVESLLLENRVAPGEAATWQWQVSSSGSVYQRFQMYQKGEPFGTDSAVIVISVPKGWEEKREELEKAIQEVIDEWKAKGEEELDKLIEELQKRAEEILKGFLEHLIQETCNSICGSLGVAMALLAIALAYRQW